MSPVLSSSNVPPFNAMCGRKKQLDTAASAMQVLYKRAVVRPVVLQHELLTRLTRLLHTQNAQQKR